MSVVMLPAKEAIATPSRTRPVTNSDAYVVTNQPEQAAKHAPITYVGASIIIDPAAMVTEQPYVVVYRGESAIAIKSADGLIAMYRIPK